MRSQNAKNTPKLEPPKDKVRDKLRALPKTTKFDFRYPIDAYEDDLVQLITEEIKLQQEALLSKLEASIATQAKPKTEYDKGWNDHNDQVKTLVNKLRLEL